MKTNLLAATVCSIALFGAAQADEWPQWRGPNRDGVWAETGIIDRFDGICPQCGLPV